MYIGLKPLTDLIVFYFFSDLKPVINPKFRLQPHWDLFAQIRSTRKPSLDSKTTSHAQEVTHPAIAFSGLQMRMMSPRSDVLEIKTKSYHTLKLPQIGLNVCSSSRGVSESHSILIDPPCPLASCQAPPPRGGVPSRLCSMSAQISPSNSCHIIHSIREPNLVEQTGRCVRICDRSCGR